MPLLIAGKPYPIPTDPGQKGLNGEELEGIEAHFGIDALVLLALDDDAAPKAGYTSSRRIYSLAWIALNRGGVHASLSEVMRDYALNDFGFQEPDVPLDSAPVETEVEAEATDSADQTDTAT
jgi:hypothetical protein